MFLQRLSTLYYIQASIHKVCFLGREETRRRRAHVQVRLGAGCGGPYAYGGGSAKPRGRRLGVERYGDVAAAVERLE